MSISDAKFEANTANAQLSTGPRTEAGKARSSRNAVKHGLFCKDVLLHGEDPQAFAFLRDGFLRRFNPRDVVELEVVEEIIACKWRLKRLRGAEQEAYRDGSERMKDEVIVFRALQNPGAKPVDPPPPSVELVTYRMIHHDADSDLHRFGRYEQRLVNNLRRHMADLEQLQSRALESEPTAIVLAALEDEVVQNEPTEGAAAPKPRGVTRLYHTLRDYQQHAKLHEMFQKLPSKGKLPVMQLHEALTAMIDALDVQNEATAPQSHEPRTAA